MAKYSNLNFSGEGQFCQVNAKELMQGPCTPENNYGFSAGQPCLLIKLNRVSVVSSGAKLCAT